LQGRAKRLFRELAASGKDVDCVAIASSAPDPNFLYFLDLPTAVFENSLLFVSRNSVDAIVPRLELSAVPAGVDAVAYSSLDEKQLLAKKFLKKFKRVGYDDRGISHANYLLLQQCNHKLKGVSRELAFTRAVKEPGEVKALAAAARLTKKAVGGAVAGLREGVSEEEVAAEVSVCFAELNASPAFDTICAFGEKTAVPHHVVSTRRLRKGDLALIDAGARLRGYCADLTETLVFGREPSFAQQSMLDAVGEAMEMALKKIRSGVQASEVHNAVSEFFDSRGFAGRFIHSLGHSIGLQVHDGLRVYGKADFALREGMVFAIEPALYVPKTGGVRLEKDVLVTRNGCRVL